MTAQAVKLDDSLIARASRRSSATLHEAAKKIGALPASIKPLAPEVRLCGRAYPVKSPSGDNLWLHHAIYAATQGDVLVIDTGENREFGYWGEVMTVAAQSRGIVGIVINGGVRDAQRLLSMHFPVFSTTPSIRGTGKNVAGVGSIGAPISIGGVAVHAGDLVLGDGDGVVILPSAIAAQAVADAEHRDVEEEGIFRRLRAGETTMQLYSLPVPSALEKGR